MENVVDIYGRIWPAGTQVCPVCKQPRLRSNTGMCSVGGPFCTHSVLPADDVKVLGGKGAKRGLTREELHGESYNPEEVIYVRRQGRYLPIGIREHLRGSMLNGHYLMTVRDGSTHYAAVMPARVEVSAALHEVQEDMVKVLADACRPTPRYHSKGPRELTSKQKKAWEAYLAAMGTGQNETMLYGLSMYDLVQRGLRVVRARLGMGD
jgi:hypothetical protein